MTEQQVMPNAAKRKRNRRKAVKWIVGLTITFAIIGGIIYGMYWLFSREKPVSYLNEMVYRGMLETAVQGWGNIKPVESADIAVLSRARVRDSYFAPGDTVYEGDLLFTLDTDELDKEIETIGKQIGVIEKQIDGVHKQIDGVHKQIDGVHKQIAGVNKQITNFDMQITEVNIKINKLNDELNILLGDEEQRIANLTVNAPYDGQLIDAAPFKVGDYVSMGDKIGVMVDDLNLTLSLFFSYAYEYDIALGQKAEISIPAAMSLIEGTVTEINKVRRISPEGTTLFEVIIAMKNPGTLTAGMEVGAVIKTGAEDIFPSEAGKLAYSRSEPVLVKAPGRLIYVNLTSFMDYKAGVKLCQIEYKEDNTQVDFLRQQIANHLQEIDMFEQEKSNCRQSIDTLLQDIDSLYLNIDTFEQDIEDLKQDIVDVEDSMALKAEGYNNLNVVAPMSGTVMYNNLKPGEMVEPGLAVISIAKLDKMMVEASIDERQVAQVRPGMPVEIMIWGMDGQMMLFGTVKSVSLTPDANMAYGGGIIYYPALFEMENYSGTLMSGQYVDYRLIVEQRYDILIAPVIAVKNTELGTCVFVKADERPENAVDLAEGIVPPGFYAVPVECGIGNENGIEILSGIGDETYVFTQIIPLDENNMNGGRW